MKKDHDSGIVVSDKLLYLCKCNQLEKTYDVEKGIYKDLLRDMYESQYKVFDYPTDCKNKAYERGKTQKRIALHINGEKASISWIQKYCKFFGCSFDFMLGLIDSPTNEIAEIKTRTGLSDNSIFALLNNKEYQLVTNALLERKGMDFIIQALQADSFYEKQMAYISRQIYTKDSNGLVIEKSKKLHGVSLSDLDIYDSNILAGYRELQENFAVVCFDEIRKDKDLVSYFSSQALQRFSDQLREDN